MDREQAVAAPVPGVELGPDLVGKRGLADQLHGRRRVDRTGHEAPRREAPAVGQLDTDGAAALHPDLTHLGTGLLFASTMANITRLALPVGGSSALPQALARLIEARGGHVETDAEVREIRVKSGRAVGVELADGRRFAARRFVASAIDAPATMKLVGESAVPDEGRTKLNAWYWGSHSLLTIHLALSEPPLYSSAKFDPDIVRAFDLFMGWGRAD